MLSHSFQCGGLFCGTCSRYRVDVDKFAMCEVRACNRCFGALQSMTLGNSLSLWEQKGTLTPPPERNWIGLRGSPKGQLNPGDRMAQGVEMLSATHQIPEFGAPAHQDRAQHQQAYLSEEDEEDELDDSDIETDASSDLSDAAFERDMKSLDTDRATIRKQKLQTKSKTSKA